ncbi:MAG: hypothetical protein KME08_10910 [Aphanothece sp. CMT-3BRIN-NPC111]|jgi:hypothetical protein|nr:hypothetical protein [Aphanothece sp. CMT-3BRIN-NPC111]
MTRVPQKPRDVARGAVYSDRQPETPLWRSPAAWGIALVGAGILGLPIIWDAQNTRLIAAFYADVSLSNLEYKTSIQQLCSDRLNHLMEGDIRLDAKFADKTIVLGNQAYQDRDRLTLQQDCLAVATPPEGIGTHPGTALPLALESLEKEIRHQRTLGNNNRVAAILAIQAAEPGQNQSPLDLNTFKTKIEGIVKDGSALAVIGPDVELQQQLKTVLAGVKNTDVCTYANGKRCIDWVFETVRKKT